jgi:hypothetical protein
MLASEPPREVRAMQIVALDGTKLIVLMLAGGAFALAGLWLMFRPQPEGEAARIELFGLKVQASSAGLLVFLIGAAFLAVPIFVPERENADPGRALAPRSEVGSGAEGAGLGGEGQTAILLPPGPDAEESEPNDTIQEANQIALGLFYSGSLAPDRDDRRDWFVVDTAELQGQDIEVQIRSVAENPLCRASIHDHREQLLDTWNVPPEGSSNYQTVFVGNADHLFLRLFTDHDYPCGYEFRVNQAPA